MPNGMFINKRNKVKSMVVLFSTSLKKEMANFKKI